MTMSDSGFVYLSDQATVAENHSPRQIEVSCAASRVAMVTRDIRLKSTIFTMSQPRL